MEIQMDQLLRDVTSFYWWISVVLLGILLNLLSTYIKPIFDRMFSKIIKNKELAKQNGFKIDNLIISAMLSDEKLLSIYQYRSTIYLLRSVLYLVFSSIFLFLGNSEFSQSRLMSIILVGMSLIMIVVFLSDFFSYRKTNKYIEIVLIIIKENNKLEN
jgi:hypothetical protein